MKTINELTKELGISRQTLYTLTKRAGISLDKLTTETRGKTRFFDEKSEEIIVNLISETRKKNVKTKADFDKELQEARKTIRQQAEEIERLKENNSLLTRTNATQTLTIQQQLTMIQVLQEREKMKLADGGEDRRAGWIRRTLRRITGKEKE